MPFFYTEYLSHWVHNFTAPLPLIDVGNSQVDVKTCTNTNNDKNDDSSDEEEDVTLQGDLGSSSSGFVGSSNLSAETSSQIVVSSPQSVTSFQTNLPVSNFPMSVCADSYRSGLGSLSLDPDNPDEDDFSEDSLFEGEESPGKRKRVTKRLEELAQQIQDRDDSLANIDSLASSSRDDNGPSLNLVDSLNPVRSDSVTSIINDTDSLEYSPTKLNRQNLGREISDINAQIKEIETRQLLCELENLEREVLSVSLTSPSVGPRPKWTVTDIEIACDDLTGNSVMSYSYEGSRRGSLTSSMTSGMTDLEMDPPVPKKATLPSPVPNLSRLASAKKSSTSLKSRPLVEHSGAVGVTSMWIPAASSTKDPGHPPMSTTRPKIHRGGSSTCANKTQGQRTNIRGDNAGAALGKKLQIKTVLPNKQRAEGI